MISRINGDLNGSPNKTTLNGYLFDFINIRVNMNLCVSKNFH